MNRTPQQTAILADANTALAAAVASDPAGTRYRLRLHPLDWPAEFGSRHRHACRFWGVPIRWDETVPRHPGFVIDRKVTA